MHVFTRQNNPNSTSAGSFLMGVPLKIEDGALHEGSVLDRFLTVRHSGRAAFEIYDPSLPISYDLLVNRSCELIVVATHFQGLKYPVMPFDIGRLGTWRGIVTDARWFAPETAYRWERPTLNRTKGKRRPWIVIAVPLGHLLMNPAEVKREIGFNVEPGDILLWQNARYDLYAIV